MEQATTNPRAENDRLDESDRSGDGLLVLDSPVSSRATGTIGNALRSRTASPPTGESLKDSAGAKHGLIKKILRRTANFSSDSKNRIKVVEVRSHITGRGNKPTTPMGNTQQGGTFSTESANPTAAHASSSSSHGHSRPNTPGPTTSLTSAAQPASSHGHVTLVHSTTVPNGDAVKPTNGGGGNSEQDQITQLTNMVERLKATLRGRDRRVHDLEREVDKLRSVLDQRLTETWPPTNSESSNALETITLNREHADSVVTSRPSSVAPPSSSTRSGDSASPNDMTPTSPTATVPAAALLLHKRLGVSGEPMRKAEELKYYEKDAKSRQQIRDALRSNELLMNLDVVQLQEMVSCMHDQEIPAGCFIIREGDDGEHLYVGAEGEYEVSKGGKRLCIMPAGRCFGELALLYNCKRTASVKALVSSRVWVLERGCFQAIMMKTGIERIEERKAFLRSVPLLKDVPTDRILRIADALEAQYHAPGDCIIRQGELADSFFIIQSGLVNVTITTTKETGDSVEQKIRQMSKGEYFGEKALLGEGRRTANVYALGPNGVEVLCLYRKDFLELIGDLQELLNRPYLDAESLTGSDKRFPPSTDTVSADSEGLSKREFGSSPTSPNSSRLIQLDPTEPIQTRLPLTNTIRLTDLERICVLGVGGFGRVDLVTLNSDRSQAFAMKRMQKQHIVQTRQQEHVHFEKLILSSVNSPFICKLYATYRDNKYVYMLMEACLGGELWTILRDSHHLDDRSTKFCLSCCIEALDYLHHHGIIYRDLKPENMLVTASGYIKMCDFGFAKFIGLGQKTWTFCGTPEYVAPEVILNKGHDFAADYWSLGILTYELLTGTPPFQASEPIKIYMKTLKGIDALGLAQNKYITLKALQFIRRLCRFSPSERLGVGKHGIQEIRSHKYFQGFDWAAIAKQTMPTPFKVKLNGPLDHSNFDRFTMDEQEPPDELSGWDANF